PGSSSCPPWAASTSTPPSCPATGGRPPSPGPSWPATPRAGSPPCRGRRGGIRAPSAPRRRSPTAPRGRRAAATPGRPTARPAARGARLLVESLRRLQEGSLTPPPQDDRLATLAPKLRPEEQVLDWNRPAVALERHIRALHPHPGAVTFHGDRRLIVERAAVVAPGEAGGSAEPGQVLEAVRHGRLLIQTGDGVLEILELRPAGKRTMTARDYLNGFPTEPGERMGSNAP